MMDNPSNRTEESPIETITLEVEQNRKKSSKQPFTWDIDNCIKLFELRKSMDETFIKDYFTSDSWTKLVKAAGWNIKWQAVRSRYNYLRKTGVPGKFKKPKTGIAGDIAFGNRVTTLSLLIHEATINNHKYNPPRMIDTSAPETDTHSENSIINHSSSETTIQPEISRGNQDSQSQPQDPEHYYHDNDWCDNIESQNDDETELPSIPSQSFSFDTACPTNGSDDQPREGASSGMSSQESNYLSIRVRKRPPTYRELIMDGQKNLERIGDDIHSFTQSTVAFHEFMMNHLSSNST